MKHLLSITDERRKHSTPHVPGKNRASIGEVTGQVTE